MVGRLCRESATSVKVFRNFKDAGSIRPALLAEGIAGGALLSVRSNEAVVFYDWATNKVPFYPSQYHHSVRNSSCIKLVEQSFFAHWNPTLPNKSWSSLRSAVVNTHSLWKYLLVTNAQGSVVPMQISLFHA